MSIDTINIDNLKEYLELPEDDKTVETSLKKLVELIGIPNSLTNLGVNVFKLWMLIEGLPIDKDLSCISDFLTKLKDEMLSEEDEALNFLEIKNKTMKSPSSKSLYPIFNKIDRLPPENLSDLSLFYKTSFNIIRLVIHLRVLDKYSASYFSDFLNNLDACLNKLLDSEISIHLKDINSYTSFLQFIGDNSRVISEISPELIKFHSIIINSSHKPIAAHTRKNHSFEEKFINSILDNKDIEQDENTLLISIPPREPSGSEFDSISEENECVIAIPEVKINGESVSRARNLHAAKRTKVKTLNRAQFLNFDWNQLTPIELNKLVDNALNEIKQFELNKNLGAFGALMTLTLGAEVLHWSYWKLSKDAQLPYLDIDSGVFHHYCEFEEKRWVPDSNQLSKLEDKTHHDELVTLPLEKHLLEALKSLEKNGANTVNELLQISPEALHDITDAWIKKTIQELGSSRWFTQKRVRDYLFFAIMSKTLDEPLASHICAQNTYQIPTGSSYATFKSSKILETYLSVQHPKLEFFEHENKEPYSVGSWLVPDEDFLRSFLSELYLRYENSIGSLNKNSSLDVIIETHNQLIDYLIITGFIATSHRPFDDPFPRLADFLFELNSVLITDKVIGIENETRPSYFGTVFSQSVQNYLVHLKNLQFWLAALKQNTAAGKVLSATSDDNQLVPLMFYLDLDTKNTVHFKSITQKKLSSRMPGFGLPWNFGRHIRASYFREKGVPVEYINYDFGHIGPGEQPHASYSPLSLKDISEVIIPIVDQLFEKFAIQAIEPMPFKQRFPPAIEIPLNEPVMQLGFQKRKANRLKSQKSDKDIIKKALNEISFHDTKSLTDNKLESAYKIILKERPQNLIKTINIFTRIVSSAINNHNLELNKPSRLYELSIERSVFSDKSSNRINLAKKIKIAFEKLLVSISVPIEKVTVTHQNVALSSFVLSLIIHSHWTSKTLISKVITALSNEDYIWIESKSAFLVNFRDANNEVYKRIPIDSLSALLALRLMDIGFSKTFNFKDWHQSKAIIDCTRQIATLISTPSLTLNKVIEASQEYAKILYTGIICSKLSGRSGYGSLDDAALVRVLENRKIDRKNREPENKNDISLPLTQHCVDLKKPSLIKNHNPNKLNNTKKFRQSLNAILNTASSKEKLKSLLVQKYIDYSSLDDATQVGLLLNGWLVFLAHQKNRSTDLLAISTIKKLFDYISVFLNEQFINQDVFSLATEALVDNYQQIVELRNTGQNTRKEGILSFHAFLVSEYEFLKINPDALEAIAEEYIDANFLTIEEQNKINEKLSSENNALQTTELFNLYCGFGLRPSEAIFRSNKDLAISGRNSYLIVKNNHLGKLKNTASKRLLPFKFTNVNLEFLAVDVDQLSKNTDSILTNAESDQSTIVAAMREVTGDSNLSLRNLRHTCATKWLQDLHRLMKNELDDNLKDLHVNEFNTAFKTRRLTFLISRLLGHGGPSTFLYHYSHGHEFIIADFIERNQSFTDKSVFYESVFELKQSTIRQWKKREKTNSSLPLTILKRVIKKRKNKHYLEIFQNY
jgi:integrase